MIATEGLESSDNEKIWGPSVIGDRAASGQQQTAASQGSEGKSPAILLLQVVRIEDWC